MKAVSPATPDERLVTECLRGNDEAWTALIEKYKRLIYSIPVKYQAGPEDAADIFQSVCLELFSELPRLRKTECLRSWLITVATRKCLRWKQGQPPRSGEEPDSLAAEPEGGAPGLCEQAEREQILREAIALLPPRCREMVRLLFYENPPLPYAEVARRLGLATGSIGFIRGRCLKRLQQNLEKMGF